MDGHLERQLSQTLLALAVGLAVFPVFLHPSWLLALQAVLMIALLRAVSQVAVLSQDSRMREARGAVQRAEGRARLLFTVSQSLRTPMHGLAGMCEMLGSTQLTDEQRDYLETVSQCGGLLYTMVDDLLLLSRADRFQLDEVEFDLRDEFDMVLATLAPQAQRKGLEISLDVPSPVPAQVVGDPVRLKQVLVNLLGNAVKYTERGEVEVRVALLRRAQGRVRLAFWVRDTGPGIAPEHRGRLFNEPIESVVSRRAVSPGLVVSKRLVEAMGGRLVLQGSDEHGSTFLFDVSLGAVPEAVASALEGTPVLLVEPDPARRRAALHQIESVGAPVVACAALEEAVRLHQADPFSYRALLVPAALSPEVLPGGLPIHFFARYPELKQARARHGEAVLSYPFSRRQLRRALVAGRPCPELREAS